MDNWGGGLAIILYLCPTIYCPRGEIGRHARLRGVCLRVCWFESSRGHFLKGYTVVLQSFSLFLVPHKSYIYLTYTI